MGDAGRSVGRTMGYVIAAGASPILAPLSLARGKDWDYDIEKTADVFGDIGGMGLESQDYPDALPMPELPRVPDAPEPEAPTEVGDEGIRKASMRRISKKRVLNHMYLTQGQDRDDMTLGGYRKTLAG